MTTKHKISNGAHKKLQGEVVSDKMSNTVVVKVNVLKTHRKYHKQYTRSKRYQADDEKNEYQVGDIVEIEEVRPISKVKRWRVVRKIR